MPSRSIPNQSTPYLTHMVSYHGQTTLVPPDNAGRIRKENELSHKSHSNSGAVKRLQDSPTRTASSSRYQHSCSCSSDSARFSIPNYPPPSFQEAMASPPVSYAPSVSTMCPTSYQDDTDSVQRFSGAFSESELTEEELSRLSTRVMLGSVILPTRDAPPASPGSDSFSDSSSSSSHEFIEVLHTEANGRRRPESPESPRDRSRALLESDPEDDSPRTPDTAKPKSRTLSLSPLRTLLPSTKGSPSSAHSTLLRASTSTSNLLARAANSPFFRSTTTLASPSSDSPRKKIFAGKGKYKAEDEPWEVLEVPSGTESQPNLRRTHSARPRRAASSPRRHSARNPMPPPPLPPIRIPPSDSSTRAESPPIVTVRTRRFPRTTVYVPSPLAHDDPHNAAANIPLPSTPGGDEEEPQSPLILSISTPPTPRHHYPGRPLPRPPGIDGAAAHLLTRPLTPPVPRVPLPPIIPPTRAITPNRGHASSQSCPEGLLIDLRESTVVQTPTSPSAMEELLDVLSDAGDNPAEPISRSRSPLSQMSNMYSEQTDLDLLASRLSDEGARAGTDYEAMSLISEFLGPASPTGTSRRRRNALSSASRSSTSTIVFPTSNSTTNLTIKPPLQPSSPFLQGSVELERRRVTKDGRVKLKLSLLGSAVDKCGICFTQFKSGETGAKGRGCKDGHAFHGSCLGRWCAASAREPRCPVCREALVGYQ